MVKQPVFFLDRDGVVVEALVRDEQPYSPRVMEEVRIIGGVAEAIEKLLSLDFKVVVVTNQPDVARRDISIDFVYEVHDYIMKNTGIEHFYVCPHNDEQGCNCRKPKPGLFWQATSDLNLDLSNSFLVGDRWKDIAAGNSVGSTCFFIDYKYNEPKPEQPFIQVQSLLDATNLVEESYDKRK